MLNLKDTNRQEYTAWVASVWKANHKRILDEKINKTMKFKNEDDCSVTIRTTQ